MLNQKILQMLNLCVKIVCKIKKPVRKISEFLTILASKIQFVVCRRKIDFPGQKV